MCRSTFHIAKQYFTPEGHFTNPKGIYFVARKRTPTFVGALFLAGDEGFEPPKTESESGVLPLH